jgi:hypothetical protein
MPDEPLHEDLAFLSANEFETIKLTIPQFRPEFRFSTGWIAA